MLRWNNVVDNAWSAIEQADLVMVQNEIPIPTIEYIVRRCHEANVKVLLNPAPAADLNPEWLELAPILRQTSMNYRPSTLTNRQRKYYWQTKTKLLLPLAVKGVGYADNGKIHTVSGFKVEPVDTTGAGDTNGAFATAIVNGKSLADALHYGNAAAALSIQRLGAQGGMPTKDEVAAFLAEN